MKNTFLIILLILQSISLFSQEIEHPDLLKTDGTWGKELFEFPIRFAREIPYTGIEEARFPKGWSTKDSSSFWSYIFAWHIDLKEELPAKQLEADLQLYFDGLMGIEIKQKKDSSIQNTVVLFIKKETSTNDSRHIGKVRTLDAFSSQKPMTLNVIADQYFCKEKKKAIIVFRFSPKEIGEDIWLRLEEITPVETICDL